MKFDPTVVETFTLRLYLQATKIVVKSALTYALFVWGGSMGPITICQRHGRITTACP